MPGIELRVQMPAELAYESSSLKSTTTGNLLRYLLLLPCQIFDNNLTLFIAVPPGPQEHTLALELGKAVFQLRNLLTFIFALPSTLR